MGPQGTKGAAGEGLVPGSLLLLTGTDEPPANYTLIGTFSLPMDTTPGQPGGVRTVAMRVYRKN